jgi:hypothetical protein
LDNFPYQGLACKPFKITQQQGRVLASYAPEYQMYVVGHDAPGNNLHALFLLAKGQAFQ